MFDSEVTANVVLVGSAEGNGTYITTTNVITGEFRVSTFNFTIPPPFLQLDLHHHPGVDRSSAMVQNDNFNHLLLVNFPQGGSDRSLPTVDIQPHYDIMRA